MSDAPPPAEALEELIDKLISAARAEGGFGRKPRLDDIDAARAALREYVSEDTRRLDWMEKEGLKRISIGPSGEFGFWLWGVLGAYFARLRDAIDNERRASRKDRPE